MFSAMREKRRCRTEMAKAATYDEWHAAARRLDLIEENHRWMHEDDCVWYDAALIRDQTNQMRRARRRGDLEGLVEHLEQGLYRHHHDVVSPQLYTQTHTGENKRLARTFLKEAATGLRYLADVETERYPDAVKLELIRRAYRRFGRSAIMLSGGATMGIYHLGVVKALFEQDLLPRVISGSSMGAIVAAGVCTRTQEELVDFFAHPERIHRQAIKLMGLGTISAGRSLFDPEQLLEHIHANIGGDFTFAEAYERTGWILNISVSPMRRRQKPKILNHISSPELLISHSTKASCAMPFLFEPGQLRARDPDGNESEYLATERWSDGSLGGDLPKARVGRLLNVNHYIVSQTNPFIYLFQSKRKTPSLPYVGFEVAASLVHSQARSLLGSARKYVQSDMARPLLERLHALTDQPYAGDINIHPRIDPLLLRKAVSNPTSKDIDRFILEGERVTWPKLAMVRDHTLINRTFETCIAKLKARCEGAPAAK